MKKIIGFFLLGLAVSISPLFGAEISSLFTYRLSAEGLGPIKIGMTVEQASAKAGLPIKGAGPVSPEDRNCYSAFPDGKTNLGVEFMVEKGKITRVNVNKPAKIQLESGVKIGSPELEVKKVFPNAKMESHFYTEQPLYFTPVKSGLGVAIETSEHLVTGFRAGKSAAIHQIEGCE